jgi:hypothetical protein
MAGQLRRRYSWALREELTPAWLRWLSPDGWDGLEYARKLARNADERRRAALDPGLHSARATYKTLASENDTSVTDVKQKISLARVELFGADLSDSAIDYQLRTRGPLLGRPCAEQACDAELPPYASKLREYCDLHATSLARIRRRRGHPPPRAGRDVPAPPRPPPTRIRRPGLG